MSFSIGGMLLLAPLIFYLLHALWRLIASDSIISLLLAVFSYLICALLFRLSLPSLSLAPVWLPFVYPYLWLGIAGFLATICCGKVSRSGLALSCLSQRMATYLLAQGSLTLGLLLLNLPLAGRPVQALVALPPFVAVAGYLVYRLLLQLSKNSHITPWWSIALALTLPPLLLGWQAEILLPLMLRYM